MLRFKNKLSPRRIREALRRRTVLRWRRGRLIRKLYRSGVLDHRVELNLKRESAFLAIVAIIRGEADFLLEWLEFYQMMGVEHFVIYDNGGDEETSAILAPYVEKNLVTLIPWPEPPGLRDRWDDGDALSIQEIAYGNCVRIFRHRINWLMKVDVDEFVYPATEDSHSIADVLRCLPSERVIGIEIPMRNFGSSGHVERPEGLVIENYRRCEGRLSRGCKSIGLAEALVDSGESDAHFFRYKIGARLRGKIIAGHEADQLLRLNHYRTKSLVDFRRKREINASGYMAGKESDFTFQRWERTHNQIAHEEILRFVPSLKERLR